MEFEKIEIVLYGMFLYGMFFVVMCFLAWDISLLFFHSSDHTFKKIQMVQSQGKAKKNIFNNSRWKTLKKEKSIPIFEKTRREFFLIDEHRASVVMMHLFFKYVLSAVFGFLAFRQSGLVGILLGVLIFKLPDFYMANQKKQYSLMFKNHAYRLFTFMANQREAGIPTSQIIKKLHHTVHPHGDGKKLRKRLISFEAEYIVSNDYDKALGELKMYYHGQEIKLLDSVLRNGLHVGDAFVVTEDTENLMFEQYMSYIDYETDKKKTESLITGICFGVSLVILIAFPIILETIEAFRTIFATS